MILTPRARKSFFEALATKNGLRWLAVYAPLKRKRIAPFSERKQFCKFFAVPDVGDIAQPASSTFAPLLISRSLRPPSACFPKSLGDGLLFRLPGRARRGAADAAARWRQRAGGVEARVRCEIEDRLCRKIHRRSGPAASRRHGHDRRAQYRPLLQANLLH